jgi:two-component system sensor histidine kinase UhpB
MAARLPSFDEGCNPLKSGPLPYAAPDRTEAEARWRWAVQAANIGLWDWDFRTNDVSLSPEWKRQLGYEDHEIPSRYEEWESRLHPEDHHRTLATLKACDAHPSSEYEVEFRLRHRDGSYRWILARAALIHDADGLPIRMLGANVDITRRKHAEAALRRVHEELERGVQERTAELSKAIDILQEQIAERHKVEDHLRRSQDQLHALSTRLLSMLEEERTRIARETHDELGQALTALKIALAWIRQRLPADQKPVQDKADQMAHLIDTTVQATRRIATELRPRVLDDLGLVPALEWHVREFQERTGIVCAFTRSHEDIAVDPGRATTLFRICQEALTNVARHAHATRVDLILALAGAALRLEVRDDGRGIPDEAVADPKSLGLLGMRERVLPWGGDIHIRGIQGRGTVVNVHIPLEGNQAGLSGALS